jgi:hypothetical protein
MLSNATDLRNLKYPTFTQLENLGRKVADKIHDQASIDKLVEELLESLPD